MPGSKVLLAWDTICIFMTLIGFWMCPFVAAFNHEDFEETTIIAVIFVHYILDVIMTLNRAVVF